MMFRLLAGLLGLALLLNAAHTAGAQTYEAPQTVAVATR